MLVVVAAATITQVHGQDRGDQEDLTVTSISGSGMMPIDDFGACTFEERVDFDGHDLQGSWLGETGQLYTNGKKAQQAYDCAVGCLANPLCKFYTFLSKRCWYKVSDAGRTPSTSKNAVSGRCVQYESTTTTTTTTTPMTTLPTTTTTPPTTVPRPGCESLGKLLFIYKTLFFFFFFFLFSFFFFSFSSPSFFPSYSVDAVPHRPRSSRMCPELIV